MSNEGTEHVDLQSSSVDTPQTSGLTAGMSATSSDGMDEDPASIGQRLRAAREKLGLTCDDVAARLKLQARLIRRIEEDDYSGMAHAVYLRGYLTSYARLLDMPLVLADRVVEKHGEQAPLVSTGRVSRSRYLLDRYSVSATYLILTALVAGPAVWLATHGGLEQNLARTVMLDAPTEIREAPIPAVVAKPNVDEQAPNSGVSAVAFQSPSTGQQDGTDSANATGAPPIIASMAPFGAAQTPTPSVSSSESVADAGKHSMVLKLSQSSWVEVTSATGEKLEYGLLDADSERRYTSAGAISVRIGNAEGAQIEADGKSIDLAPFRRANVASLRVFGASKLASDIDS